MISIRSTNTSDLSIREGWSFINIQFRAIERTWSQWCCHDDDDDAELFQSPLLTHFQKRLFESQRSLSPFSSFLFSYFKFSFSLFFFILFRVHHHTFTTTTTISPPPQTPSPTPILSPSLLPPPPFFPTIVSYVHILPVLVRQAVRSGTFYAAQDRSQNVQQQFNLRVELYSTIIVPL